MTYIIGMVSQKGGSGKSTLARLFARELARDGFAVKIADLDTQQTTCADWAADRAEASVEPEIQAQAFGKLATALREAERYDVYILDGRPHSSEQTVEIARAANLVVIPTGQTKDDLKPAVRLAHALAQAGTSPERIAFALVRTTGSLAELAAARAYLQSTDYVVLDGALPVSTAYGIAHDMGRAATETTHRSLNAKAEQLAQAIIDRLTAVAAQEAA
jgi:chromosome partitioning protein